MILYINIKTRNLVIPGYNSTRIVITPASIIADHFQNCCLFDFWSIIFCCLYIISSCLSIISAWPCMTWESIIWIFSNLLIIVSCLLIIESCFCIIKTVSILDLIGFLRSFFRSALQLSSSIIKCSVESIKCLL